jgi:hypothetical protein
MPRRLVKHSFGFVAVEKFPEMINKRGKNCLDYGQHHPTG